MSRKKVYNIVFMKESGIIIKLEENNTAIVQFEANSACKKCNACLLGNKGEATIMAENSIKARIGDKVEVNIRPSQVVWSSFLAFIIPLFAMGIGYYLGSSFAQKGSGENFSILLSMLFLGLSFLGLGIYDKKLKSSSQSKASITRIV